MGEKIIVVDKKDREIKKGEKIEVHKTGLLHRAFSVFVFNSDDELLIQKRSSQKYHSSNLWSNTCCSHPRPGKDLREEAKRRLREEMGFECYLEELFTFYYKVEIGNFIENEIDHVFVGRFDGKPNPIKKEVSDWRWVRYPELRKDIKNNPNNYTYWFRLILGRVIREKRKSKTLKNPTWAKIN